MAAPAVVASVVTPTGYLVVEWGAVTGATAYSVTALCAGVHSLTTAFGATVTRGRVGRMQVGRAYVVTVTATVGGAPVVGTSTTVTCSLRFGYGDVVRQAVWDALYGATITTADGRTATALQDGWYRPDAIRRGQALSAAMPVIEVGAPMLEGTSRVSSTRRREVWSVPLAVLDACEMREDGAGSAGAGGDLEYLMSQAQAAVDDVSNLGVAALSVLERGWTWGGSDRTSERGRVARLATTLRVPVFMTAGEVVA